MSERSPSGAAHDEFVAFVQARQHRLLRSAYLVCGDHHQAEDLLQGALVKLALRWAQVRDGDPEAYLRTVGGGHAGTRSVPGHDGRAGRWLIELARAALREAGPIRCPRPGRSVTRGRAGALAEVGPAGVARAPGVRLTLGVSH